MDFYWILVVWVVISIVVMFLMGRYRKFVTKKLSGKIVIVTRIRVRCAKITMLLSIIVATVTFIAIFGTDIMKISGGNDLPEYVKTLWYLFPLFTMMVVYCYYSLLRFVYEEASKLNGQEVKEEIVRYMCEHFCE